MVAMAVGVFFQVCDISNSLKFNIKQHTPNSSTFKYSLPDGQLFTVLSSSHARALIGSSVCFHFTKNLLEKSFTIAMFNSDILKIWDVCKNLHLNLN